jgi:hypothetical protein
VHLFLVTWRFWWLRGRAAEFVHLADEILAGSEDLPAYQRAMALTGAGFAFVTNGYPARAQQVFGQSLPLYNQVSESLGSTLKASVLAILGHLAAFHADYDRASKFLDQGRAVLRELSADDLTGYDRLQYFLTAAFVDNFLGQLRLSQDDGDAAARLFTDGLAAARHSLDSVPILISLYDLALARQAEGDLAGAAEHLKEGLALAAAAGDETSTAYYLEVLAAVAGRQDDLQRAARLLAAAHSILEASGSGWLQAYAPRVRNDDAGLTGLRSRMGDAAFQDAQAWGESAGRRRAVDYALQQG